MSPGLPWMRHRQRRLAKALLVLFGLVWLQLAAMPCIGAHQASAGVAAHSEHCPYCPPSIGAADAGHCDDGGQCAYPHEPGVDARCASMALLPASTATPLAGLLQAPCSRAGAHADRADPVPRRSLSVSYCRFIE